MCYSAARLIAALFRGKPAHATIMEGKIYTPARKKKRKKQKPPQPPSHISYRVIIAPIQGSVLHSVM